MWVLLVFRRSEYPIVHGHSVIKVPGEEACYHLYHSGVVDNTGRYAVAIALSEAAHVAL